MRFGDIKGNQKLVKIIEDSVKAGLFSGAYLFCGQEGVGKFTLAKVAAKSLNCQAGSGPIPCGSCSSCIKADKSNHPDISILDFGEEEIKIEYIRQLQKDISLRPYEGRSKVYIINNAHNLNAESSNAFLKTLEEPPGKSALILVSSKPNLIFKTIISRCKVFRFASLSREELSLLLAENYGIDKDSAHFLAYFSEGSLGRALAMNASGLSAEKDELIKGIFQGERQLESLMLGKGKDDLRRHLNIMAAWFRDVYLAKAGLSEGPFINLRNKREVIAQSQRYSFEELEELEGLISDSLYNLERNVNPKLIVSNMLVSFKN